ncbi:4078_t:CDS:1, partial [Racocetra fulgida]
MLFLVWLVTVILNSNPVSSRRWQLKSMDKKNPFPELPPLSKCKISGNVRFIPQYNIDNLFTEVLDGNETIVDGVFSTPIGVSGIKTISGKPVYTAELLNMDEIMIYDLTVPVFNNAIELVTPVPYLAPLTICGKDSIIGKTVVIKRQGKEIARAVISALKSFERLVDPNYT